MRLRTVGGGELDLCPDSVAVGGVSDEIEDEPMVGSHRVIVNDVEILPSKLAAGVDEIVTCGFLRCSVIKISR